MGKPPSPVVMQQLQAGIQAHNQGNFSAAEAYYRQALAAAPKHPDALHLLALALLQQDKPAEAQPFAEKAVKANGKIANFHNTLGEVHRRLGNGAKASRAYVQALKLDPRHRDANNNYAIILRDQGKWDKAESHFRQAIAANPNHVEALINLSGLLVDRDNAQDALAPAEKAAALVPKSATAQAALARAHRHLGNYDAALERLNEALTHEPGNVSLVLERSAVYIELARFEEAHKDATTLLAHHWSAADVHLNAGSALVGLSRLEEALEHFHHAQELNPENLNGRLNLAMTLRHLGRLSEAEEEYRKAIKQHPGEASVEFGLAFTQLLAGRWVEGWAYYRSRWRFRGQAEPAEPLPRWDGNQDVAGKRLWVAPEQGYGDVIQFARYLPLLAAAGAEVIFPCPAPLEPLFRTQEGVVIVAPDAEPDADLAVAIGDLPGILGPEPLARKQYLSVPDDRRVAWESRIAKRSAVLDVGIAWQGSKDHPNDRLRSCPMAAIEALGDLEGVQLHSLQLGDEVPGGAFAHGEAINDFGDLAGLMNAMDLIISVDSAPAHLAGALGKPAWIMLAKAPDWRWGLEATTTDWYASATLFRQQAWNDWSDVIEQMKVGLEQFRQGRTVQPTVAPRDMPERTVTGGRPSETLQEDGYTVLVETRDGPMLCNRHDAYVGRSLRLYGEFSYSERALFEDLIKAGDVVLEAGANIGAHTIPLARMVGPEGRVIAYEPQRLVFQTLCGNVSLAGLAQVQARQAGLGSKAGTAEIPLPDPNRPSNFGGIGFTTPRHSDISTETVSVERVDDLALEALAFLKADVEGMESEVLAGAVNTIERLKPILYLECDRDGAAETMMATLRPFGYRYYRHMAPLFNPGNWAENTENVFDDIVSGNLLAIPSGLDFKAPDNLGGLTAIGD